MGFGNETHQLKTYVNIFGGKLAVQAKEGDEGAISRTNKNNKTVWEKHYPDLTGFYESVEVKKNEHLKAYEYVIHLSDTGMHYYVSIPCESRYGDNFARKAPNLKFGQEITLKPYDFEDKETRKKRIGLTIIQNGAKIESFYTKEDPKGLPMLNEKVDEETYKIHNIQVNKFLRESVAKLATTSQPSIKEAVMAKNEAKQDGEPFTKDDLPF